MLPFEARTHPTEKYNEASGNQHIRTASQRVDRNCDRLYRRYQLVDDIMNTASCLPWSAIGLGMSAFAFYRLQISTWNSYNCLYIRKNDPGYSMRRRNQQLSGFLCIVSTYLFHILAKQNIDQFVYSPSLLHGFAHQNLPLRLTEWCPSRDNFCSLSEYASLACQQPGLLKNGKRTTPYP
jgi:hypothetical protein